MLVHCKVTPALSSPVLIFSPGRREAHFQRYKVFKFEFLVTNKFLVTKCREIQILKPYIFGLDKDISKLFFDFEILVKSSFK